MYRNEWTTAEVYAEQAITMVREHDKPEVEQLRAGLATLREMNAALRMAIKREALAGYRNHKAYERVKAELASGAEVWLAEDTDGNRYMSLDEPIFLPDDGEMSFTDGFELPNTWMDELLSPGECRRALIVLDAQ